MRNVSRLSQSGEVEEENDRIMNGKIIFSFFEMILSQNDFVPDFQEDGRINVGFGFFEMIPPWVSKTPNAFFRLLRGAFQVFEVGEMLGRRRAVGQIGGFGFDPREAALDQQFVEPAG